MTETNAPQHNLFRKAVLKNQGQRLWGDLVVTQPLSIRLYTLSLILLVSIFGLFLSLNSFTRKQEVTGLLQPDLGLVDVHSSTAGNVTKLVVKQGEQVSKGQILVEIKNDLRASEDGYLADTLLEDIFQQEELLNNSIKHEYQKLSIELEKIETNSAHIQENINYLQLNLDRELELYKLKQGALGRAEQLHDSGHLSLTDLEKVKAEVLLQQRIVSEFKQKIRTASHENQALLQNKESLLVEYQLSRSLSEQNLAVLHSKGVQQYAESEIKIVSPIAGRISNVNVYSGQIIDSNQALLSIIPQGSRLQANLLLPSNAIGFIEPGQKVNIRYQAFPYQKFGVHSGQIISVTESAQRLSDYEMSRPGFYYRVIVEPDEQELHAYNSQIPLRPGMELSANIEIEERSLLEWLLDPLFSMKKG